MGTEWVSRQMKILRYWVSVIIVAVLLNIGYHYTLKKYDGHSFRFFNYQILIYKGDFHVYDRIVTIEMKQKEQTK